MRHFCTYFDRNYLLRALVLYESLRDTAKEFTLWCLCLDDEAYRILGRLALPGLVPVSLADIEAHDPELAATKVTRSKVEYFFTLTPALPLFLLDRHPAIDVISYLDADLRFYASPSYVLDEMRNGSTLIIPHSFSDHLLESRKHGIYNVGMICFRNDANGRAVLERWLARCIEWCYDRVEDGRFADQGYLDDWPEVHPGVVVLDRPGVGLAPWNFSRFHIDVRATPPTVDGHPLVFYHFHAFRGLGSRLFSDGLGGYGRMASDVRAFLYAGYVRDLRRAAGTLRDARLEVAATGRHARMGWRQILHQAGDRRLLLSVGDWVLA